MTGRYDEWAAARAASLRCFARALGDGRACSAEAAVHRALTKVEARWERLVSRDDPDLVARGHVVAAIGGGAPARRRAAALLRTTESRSDAEIAEVLRCSESAARIHLTRGLARVPLRVGPDTAPGPIVTRRLGTDSPRRRRRASGAWQGALAVVALVGGIAVADRLASTPPGVVTYPSVSAPAGWRTESYGGVQVQVPATWGWGGAPFRSEDFGGSHLGGCGSDRAAVRSPSDPASYVSSVTPFVGRPAQTSFRCAPWGSDGVVPRTDAVWLGSPLTIGVRTVHGVLAETRAVGTQHVTVFSGRSALRRQVLGTAQVVSVDDNGCPTRAVLRPQAGPDHLVPTSLSVCVYSQDTGVTALEWSGRVGAAGARSYEQAVRAAADRRPGCSTLSGQWVAIGTHGDGEEVRWDLAVPRCGTIESAPGAVPMTAATVRDWATGGIAAYVAAPPDRALAGWFRGALGGGSPY